MRHPTVRPVRAHWAVDRKLIPQGLAIAGKEERLWKLNLCISMTNAKRRLSIGDPKCRVQLPKLVSSIGFEHLWIEERSSMRQLDRAILDANPQTNRVI
jgi:hypothetical protein